MTDHKVTSRSKGSVANSLSTRLVSRNTSEPLLKILLKQRKAMAEKKRSGVLNKTLLSLRQILTRDLDDQIKRDIETVVNHLIINKLAQDVGLGSEPNYFTYMPMEQVYNLLLGLLKIIDDKVKLSEDFFKKLIHSVEKLAFVDEDVTEASSSHAPQLSAPPNTPESSVMASSPELHPMSSSSERLQSSPDILSSPEPGQVPSLASSYEDRSGPEGRSDRSGQSN